MKGQENETEQKLIMKSSFEPKRRLRKLKKAPIQE